MNLLPRLELEVEAALPRDAFVEAIRGCLRPPGSARGWSAAPWLSGEIDGDRVRLEALPRQDERGFFVTGRFGSICEAEGPLVERGDRTVLRAGLRIRPRWRRQFSLGLAFAALGPLTAVLLVLGIEVARGGGLPAAAPLAVVAVALAPFGLLRVVLQSAAERERRVIIGVLNAALLEAERGTQRS